ncbi:MAG: type II toxin-antitoxin system RelE/ParE family toxin [Candidatus Electrothrix aestuarii]|uniref:Type II toxin-antitoxin system RelE/ParE family toxin n=1 Tax=Candidatus Electrothrix aestuarii TaxID=3062594 RepID=A0AAU8M1A4_9BACT|nr:type II toxin-antitoxin system RelE/ParE family toxin [Candidatus Electrothrix aestuarii]
MIAIRKTKAFVKWLDKLRDIQARSRVLVRIKRLADGNPGDVKSVGEGIYELRIHYGPGYRVYYTKIDDEIVLLLVGGNKSTQSSDIEKAQRLARNV